MVVLCYNRVLKGNGVCSFDALCLSIPCLLCDCRPLETCPPEHRDAALFFLVVASSKEEEREVQERIGREIPGIMTVSPQLLLP
jgi:hypothetical protein